MKHSCVELIDLPDELLMIIFQKLNSVDVLYSLLNINRRLNRIVRDPIFTSCLILLKRIANDVIDVFPSDAIRDRFCREILPEIRHQIQSLSVESSSMKDVLRAADYSHLQTLGLFNVDENSIQCLCQGEVFSVISAIHQLKCIRLDETLSSSHLKKQVRKLLITIDNQYLDVYNPKLNTLNPLIEIFTFFVNLNDLTVAEFSDRNYLRFHFDSPCANLSSSNLLKLFIKVGSFDDCLHILDGRFPQLQTFHVDVETTFPPCYIPNQVSLLIQSSQRKGMNFA